jgi:hypothetical protein
VARDQKLPVAWMKVYDASGNYLASCVDAGSAAAVVSLAGAGATIRNGHAKKNVIWAEGNEVQLAAESYDFVAQIIHDRTTADVPVVDAEHDRRIDSTMTSSRSMVWEMLSSTPKS